MATDDHERYCRLTLLTHKGGKFVGEHILVREIDRLYGSPTLVAFLGTKKRHLKDKKYRHEITTNQFYMLYPRDGTDTNVEDWDLHLLLKIILEFFTSTLTSQCESDLREIQRIRNEVCHMSEPKLCELEFEASMDALVGCIYRLTKCFDESMAVKAIKIIGDFRSGPLSPKQMKEMVAQVGIHDEQMKYVVDVLARFGVKQEDNSTVINELLERVKKIENSVTSSEKHRIHIPNVQTQLTISGDREETVTKANDLVLHNLNVAIDNEEDPNDKERMKCVMTDTTENSARQCIMVSPTDERVIKRTVREMVQEIEGKTSKVVSAQRGSILINIQCNTLSGLKELLMWLKEKEYRSCLQTLKGALESYFISKFDVDLTLSEGSILELSNWAGLCMSNQVNAQTDTVELPYKAKVNIAVKCQSTEAVSRVVTYFTHGDAANRLNYLSETLSNAVGGRIRVYATLDTAKLLTDLKKAETDLSIRETSRQLTTQTTPDEPGYTDIKTSDEVNTSNTDQTLSTLEQDVSNISLDVNEKAVQTDLPMLETSPLLTTQMSSDKPGYTDIKTSDEANTSNADQSFPTLGQDVSNISLHVSEKAETDLPMMETSPHLIKQTTTDETGYTDIKIGNENTSNTDPAFPTLEQHISNISLDINDTGVQSIRGRDRFKENQMAFQEYLMTQQLRHEYLSSKQEHREWYRECLEKPIIMQRHQEDKAWHRRNLIIEQHDYLVEHYEYLMEQQEHQIQNQEYLTTQKEYLVEQREYLSKQKKHMEYLMEHLKHQEFLMEQEKHQAYLVSQQEYLARQQVHLMEQQKYLENHQEYLAKQLMRLEYLAREQENLKSHLVYMAEWHRYLMNENLKRQFDMGLHPMTMASIEFQELDYLASQQACLVDQQKHIKDLAGQQEYLAEYQIYLTMQQKEHGYLATQPEYRVRQQVCLDKQQKFYEYLAEQYKRQMYLVEMQQEYQEDEQKYLKRQQIHMDYQHQYLDDQQIYLEKQQMRRMALHSHEQDEYLREQQEYLAKQKRYNIYLAYQLKQKEYLTNKQEYLAMQQENLTEQLDYLSKKQMYHAKHLMHIEYMQREKRKHKEYLTSKHEYLAKQQKHEGYMAKQPDYMAVQQKQNENQESEPGYVVKQQEYLESKQAYLATQQAYLARQQKDDKN